MSRDKLRHQLRSAFDFFASVSGLLNLRERQMCQGLTILTYHRILPWEQCVDYPLQSLVIPVDIFRRQIELLAAHCQVLPVSTALCMLENGGPFQKPLVSVTFDDGYADNYALAAPILEDYALRGTFFIASGFVASGGPQWYDSAAVAWQKTDTEGRLRLLDLLRGFQHKDEVDSIVGPTVELWMDGLKRVVPEIRQELLNRAEHLAKYRLDFSSYRPMSKGNVYELYVRGHEIGSHTINHPIMPQLTNAKLHDEIQLSADQLRDWTGGEIKGFCYPNGDYDVQVERAVIQAGYTYACTLDEGLNRTGICHHRLKRLAITMRRTLCDGRYSPLGFRAELSRTRALLRRYK